MAGIAAPLLDVRGFRKSFGAAAAIGSVSFTVERGEFLAVLGPSGCGKTTLLRCVAGLEHPDSGELRIEGQDYTGSPAFERPLNSVFQSLALFPHMTVFDNVAYGPRRRGIRGRGLGSIVNETLGLVGLPGAGKRYPAQLSGGQQQRVALARAIVNKPKLLLLDEPLSALDLKLRRRMQLELKQLQRKLGISFVLVTHDQEEAMTLADRIIVMNEGLIGQTGTPQQIYAEPTTRFVAEFIGDANFFPEDWLRQHWLPGAGHDAGEPVPLKHAGIGMVRPENVRLGAPSERGAYKFGGVISGIASANGITTVYLDVPELSQILTRDMTGRGPPLRKGQEIEAHFFPAHLHAIPPEGGGA
jgi:spermidine/putrescine transport system ATP-binding protein